MTTIEHKEAAEIANNAAGDFSFITIGRDKVTPIRWTYVTRFRTSVSAVCAPFIG